MSEGKLCESKIEIHNALPMGCAIKPNATNGIEVTCEKYYMHGAKHTGTVINNEGEPVGEIKWI